MTRLPDWQSRLTAYMRATVAERKGAITEPDCALFAAGAVLAMTGTDPAAEWRNRYPTVAAGQRMLRRAGFTDHVALVATQLPEIPPAMARVGDIAVIASDGLSALGIVQGARIYVLGPTGVATVPLTSATRAFKV
jgi:hypothetical protein